MKYGYLFYKKPLPELRKERPYNLGDPIQSIAVINLYKEMGISDADIVPIDRYDLARYDGEDAVVTINGAETYEHYAYRTAFLPPSRPLFPVYFSLHIRRELDNDVIDNFKEYGPVGCRDQATVDYLRKHGTEAYLTGCLTLTYPRREETTKQKSVFFIDCPESLKQFVPEDIKKDAIYLSQVERLKSSSRGNRITSEETVRYHTSAQARIDLLRDQARLVVTSRFHVAVPSLAMGIPVVLVGTSFCFRFALLEKFLPMHTPDRFHEINWHQVSVNIEEEKGKIKDAFFSAVRFAVARKNIANIYGTSERKFQWPARDVIPKIPFPRDGKTRYAVWGICMPYTQHLVEGLQETYKDVELYAAIDTFQAGEYMGKPILQPERISALPEDVIVLVPAPPAHGAALELMRDTPRKFALIKGSQINCFHFDQSLR